MLLRREEEESESFSILQRAEGVSIRTAVECSFFSCSLALRLCSL